MTVRELSQLYYLKREIELDEKRLSELENIASYPRSLTPDSVSRAPVDNRAVERYTAEILDLQAIISAKRMQCVHELRRLERYISGIEDSDTRQIFIHRFVQGLSWEEVAFNMGAGNTVDRVKKRCYRYLRRKKDGEN